MNRQLMHHRAILRPNSLFLMINWSNDRSDRRKKQSYL